MKPFHQWLNELSNQLSPIENSENKDASKGRIGLTSLSQVERLCTGVYLIENPVICETTARQFNCHVVACIIGGSAQLGCDWATYINKQNGTEFEYYHKFVAPFIRFDLLGDLE